MLRARGNCSYQRKSELSYSDYAYFGMTDKVGRAGKVGHASVGSCIRPKTEWQSLATLCPSTTAIVTEKLLIRL